MVLSTSDEQVSEKHGEANADDEKKSGQTASSNSSFLSHTLQATKCASHKVRRVSMDTLKIHVVLAFQ